MSNRLPLVIAAGQVRELPAGDLLLGAGLVKESVDAGQTLTIPAGFQYAVHGSFEVSGVLDMQGKMVLQ